MVETRSRRRRDFSIPREVGVNSGDMPYFYFDAGLIFIEASDSGELPHPVTIQRSSAEA
jgi:hypothetical protein